MYNIKNPSGYLTIFHDGMVAWGIKSQAKTLTAAEVVNALRVILDMDIDEEIVIKTVEN